MNFLNVGKGKGKNIPTMQDRANPTPSPPTPNGNSNPAPREGGFLTEHREEFKHMPELGSKGKFVREGLTLHRQNVVTSQRLKVIEQRGTEKRPREKKDKTD